MMTSIFLIGGLALLYFGAEWLISGSASLAVRAGVPPLVIGLTVVAFGTSAPELVVSVQSSFNGLGSLAVGNAVGSNIMNIAVILGISAIIRPLKVNVQVLRVDAVLMIIASIVLWLLLLDHRIGRLEGIGLALSMAVYMILTVYFGKQNVKANPGLEDLPPNVGTKKRSLVWDLTLIVLGLTGLVLGSKFFVRGAIDVAQFFGMPEAVIGLTIVAAGTSFPELATSVVASAKGEEDIAVGNIIGSNIFNILAILGIAGALFPIHAPGIQMVDLALMTGCALIIVPLMWTGYRLVRSEGILLVLIYGGYLWYLWP